MSNVINWRKARFDEILKRVDRKILLDDSSEYDCVGVRWYGMGAFIRERQLGMNISRKQQWIIRAGDVVYNKLFAWKGSFAVAGENVDGCIVSDKFPIYQLDESMVDINYLRYYFRAPIISRQAQDLSKGAAAISKLTLNPPEFWELTIPLPPLEEQCRIVARIEELATQIEEARELQQETKVLGERIAIGKARELIHKAADAITPLSNWLDTDREGIQTGPFGAQLASSDFSESGVPILTIGNIQYEGLKLDNLKYVSEEKADQLSRYSLCKGDILFARMGTVGRCCVVPREVEGWLINYHIIRVAVDKSRVNPRYIHWVIRASSDVEEYLQDKIRGATRQGVNSSIVSNLPCRVPLLDEQNAIVAYLDDLQEQITTVTRLQLDTEAELNALLPSILDKAFKGEL